MSKTDKRAVIKELITCLVFMAAILALGAIYYIIWPGYY